MAKLDTATPTTPEATEETMMKATNTTQTRRLRTRRLVALATVVALLLALATTAALRQARTAGPVSRAPVAAPALAHDGYAPTGLDYREDHRSDVPAGSTAPSGVPCPGRDLALAGACGPAGGDAPRAPAAPAQSGGPPCLTADGEHCGPPAPAPAPEQDPNAPHLVP